MVRTMRQRYAAVSMIDRHEALYPRLVSAAARPARLSGASLRRTAARAPVATWEARHPRDRQPGLSEVRE